MPRGEHNIDKLISRALACTAVVCLAGGCSLFKNAPVEDYRTVQASEARDTPAAVKHHSQALALMAKCADPCCCECVAKLVCNPCRVERHLQDALIADVRYGPAHNTLGTLYYRQHKFYLAAWEFEYASRLMPGRPEPLNNLGLVYEESGKLDQAVDYYREAVDLAPNNTEYLGNYARAQIRAGAPQDETRYWLEQVVFHDSRCDWVAWAKDTLGENSLPYGRIEEVELEVGSGTPEDAEPIPAPRPTGPELIEPEVELVNPLSQVSFEQALDGRVDWISAPREFEPKEDLAEIPATPSPPSF